MAQNVIVKRFLIAEIAERYLATPSAEEAELDQEEDRLRGKDASRQRDAYRDKIKAKGRKVRECVHAASPEEAKERRKDKQRELMRQRRADAKTTNRSAQP